MRTLNVRLAAICLVVVVLFGGGVHLLHGFQVHRQANALKVASERAYREGRGLAFKAFRAQGSKNPSERTDEKKDLDEEIRLFQKEKEYEPIRPLYVEAMDDKAIRELDDEAIRKLDAEALRRSADDGPAQSDDALGQSDEAIRQLRSYLFLVPKDVPAQLFLGMLYVQRAEAAKKANDPRGLRGNAGAAFSALEEALRAGEGSLPPEDVRKAHRKAAEMALNTQDIHMVPAAEAHLAALMQETPDDPDLLLLEGRALVYEGKNDEACEQFRKAIKIAPTQIDGYRFLAGVLRQRPNTGKAEADQVMLEMVNHKDNAKSVEVFQTYAEYLRQEEKYDEALLQTKKVLELAPEDPQGLWTTGACYLAKKQYTTAEGFLKRGIKADSANPGMYKIMAEIQNHLGRHDEALKVLRQGLEAAKGPGYAEILWDLVNDDIMDGKFDEADKQIKELRGLGYKPARMDFAEAELAVVKGEWNVAKTALTGVVPKLHDDPRLQKAAYLYLGRCDHQLGEVEQEMLAYAQALSIDPDLPQAHVGLAEIYLSKGKFGEAADEYRQVLNGPRTDFDVALAYARVLIMMRLREDKEKRDWEPVEKLLDQIEKQAALVPAVAVLRAEVLLAKSLPIEAEKLLRQCSEKYPKSVAVWLALINLDMFQAEQETEPGAKQKKWNLAAEAIDLAEKNLGDQPLVRQERASCAVRRKDPQAAAVLKKLGENLDAKMSDPARKQLWGSLAGLSIQIGDFALARSYVHREAEADPTNIRLWAALFQLDLRTFEKGQTPDLEELDQRLAAIERLGGRGAFWLYGKAVRTLVQSQKTDPQLLQEAQGYLKEGMELRKDWPAPADLAGEICELQHEPDQALEYYLHAIRDLGERDSDVMRRAVHLLVPRRRYDEARQLFDYLEKQKNPILGEMNEDLVYVRAFRGDIAEAEKDVDNLVAAGDKNDKELLRQGQLYGVLAHRLKLKAQSEKRDWRTDPAIIRMAQKAIDALLKSAALNPQSDEVWLGAIQLLADVGQPEKAKPLMDKAEASLKDERAPLTLGSCCELLSDAARTIADEAARAVEAGKASTQRNEVLQTLTKFRDEQTRLAAYYAEKAQAKYLEALKASPQNIRVLRQVAGFYLRSAKPNLAESFLRQIIALDSPATLNDACWARRNLADILMNRGDFADLCQGLALINENISKAATIEDKRTRVTFLLADPRREKIGEAIQCMEDLVKSGNARPDDSLTLAKLYLRKGDWTNFGKRMHSVLGAQQGAAARALVFYISALLERRELNDADTWLRALEKAAPDYFDTVRLRAEYLFLCEQYDAAGNLVMAFLDNPNAQPKDRGEQLLRVAMAMENFGDRLKATQGTGYPGKPDIAGGFDDKAGKLFGSLRNIAGGEIAFAAYLARQKRIGECLKVLEQCADKCPPEALQIAALTVVRSKAADAAQYAQLEAILLAAANRSKRPVPMLLLLAEIHALQQQYDKTIADYREVLAKDPRNYQAMNNLGLNLARSGRNLDEALKLINDALAIRGPLAEVLDSRAVVYIARQEYDKALDDMAAAIQDDGAAEQCFHQAWAYWLAGKKSEASAAFAEATKKHLDPKALDLREVSVFDQLKGAL